MSSARDSLKPLFGDGVHPQDSIYGKLEMVDQMASEEGMYPIQNLEFPLNVGSDEVNHFVLFNIYSDIAARMETEEEAKLTSALSEINNYRTVSGVAVASTAALTKTGPWISKKIPKVGGRTTAIITGTTIIGSYLLGDWIGAMIGNAAVGDSKGIQTRDEWLDEMNTVNENMEFGEAVDIAQGRFTRFGKAKIRNQDTIALYMPQKIQSLGVLEYEQQDLSIARNVVSDKGGLLKSLGITKITGGLDMIAGIVGTDTNIRPAVMGHMRIAKNPRKQLNFREPVSRKFELNFNLSPKNEMESVRAYQIIQTFKKHAYPRLERTWGNGTFYKFPAEFEVEYYTMQNGEPVENDWLNKIGRCALREVNVDYAAGGAFSTFENGAPTHMNLSLTFEEMRLIDGELVEQQGY
ncbi:MAG: hypothetical protein H8D80_01785 [Proteobacteria bacterium]|nr:hypothetical protein [Pseudomonadota bacterium]